MFLAVILICSSLEANSCEVAYNTQKVFVTEQACLEDLEATKQKIQHLPIPVIKTGCIVLPGESA